MNFSKYLSRAVLVAVLSFSMAVPAFAATKAEVQQEIQNLKVKDQELESQLADLRKNKKDTESYIAELDAKIKEYLGKLEKVSAEITKTEAEITLTQEKLEEAKEDEKEQYEALKVRIKAMYEAGDTDYLSMLLESKDLKTLLNDSEYISKINEYDHNLLVSLQEIRDKIAQFEAELQEKKELQEAQKEEFELEKASLEKIVAEKEKELVALGENIESVNYSISQTQSKISEENALLAQIVEQERKAAEEAARKAAAAEAARKAAAAEAARKAAAEEAARKQQAEQAARAAAAQQAASSQETVETVSYPSTGSASSDSYEEDTSYSSYEDTSSTTTYEEPATSSTGMIWPCGATNITSYFGYRDAPTAGATSYHQGIDIGAGYGASVWAAAGGTVSEAGYGGALGNYVIVSHGNGVSTLYAHLSAIYVSSGQSVSQGTSVGAVGSTGVSTGAHLHFGVIVGGGYVNPLYYVSP